jgi:hypothetical protein
MTQPKNGTLVKLLAKKCQGAKMAGISGRGDRLARETSGRNAQRVLLF